MTDSITRIQICKIFISYKFNYILARSGERTNIKSSSRIARDVKNNSIENNFKVNGNLLQILGYVEYDIASTKTDNLYNDPIHVTVYSNKESRLVTHKCDKSISMSEKVR